MHALMMALAMTLVSAEERKVELDKTAEPKRGFAQVVAETVLKLERSLDQMTAAWKDAKTPAERRRLRTAIKATETQLAKIKARPQSLLVQLNPLALHVGQVGAFPRGEMVYKVFQVVGPNSMLVQARYSVEEDRIDMDFNVHTDVYWKRGPVFLLRGVSTRRFSDGVGITLSGIYEVTGNSSYDSASGAVRTVLAVQRIDPPPE